MKIPIYLHATLFGTLVGLGLKALELQNPKKIFGLAHQSKDIVFRFITEYSSLRDFGPYVIGLFLYEEF